MTASDSIVIVGAARTPMGAFQGDFKDVAAPVLGAVKSLMASGIYLDILKKWGVESGAITNPAINGATS